MRYLTKAGWVAVTLCGTALLLQGCAAEPAISKGAPPTADQRVASSPPGNPLADLAMLAVKRINTGDEVSAAKFGTPQSIDDPVREQQVLNAVATQSSTLGINPAESTQFFRDQIEASKVVQRGLYQLWTAHPELRPTTKPDLTKKVRPELDLLTDDIMRQLKATAAARHANAQHCGTQSSQAFDDAAKSLDQLHRQALTVALRSVCISGRATTN